MDTSGKTTAVNAPADEMTRAPQLQSSLDIELVALSETAPPQELEKPRNKFRLAAILTALYVSGLFILNPPPSWPSTDIDPTLS